MDMNLEGLHGNKCQSIYFLSDQFDVNNALTYNRK